MCILCMSVYNEKLIVYIGVCEGACVPYNCLTFFAIMTSEYFFEEYLFFSNNVIPLKKLKCMYVIDL